MKDFRGRVSVVTGAASGIGKALSAALAVRGSHVVLADIDTAGVEATAKELHAANPAADFLPVTADVADESSVAALADAAFDRFGAVHVLCNNAGISSAGAIWEGPIADWSRVWSVNLMGAVHGCRAFLPRMIVDGSEGHVINVASMAGLHAVEFKAPYTAAKHALVGLSQCLRAELAAVDARVRVSVVCPGPVSTPIMVKQEGHYAGREVLPDAAQRVLDELRATVDKGMPAAYAAALILDAVQSERFWVFPNAEPYLQRVAREHNELQEDGMVDTAWTPVQP
ncbi:SDR family NAD(P)-dependent oxidoreductase [Pseudonocardia sp. GCM10023141]|uniref:SDR family NAD(P)-dependent oxidoreductase n=1 Tax=Pseudonocardia sp. GCM10023141 TaxID=3252653 RepID=UPI00360969BB